ncbi:unnamed protein product [Urochloa humidicola]
MDERGAFSPAKRRLPKWHLSVLDGEPAPARAVEAFPDSHWERDDIDGNGRRPNSREARASRRRYNNNHPDFERYGGRRHDDDPNKHGRDGHTRRGYNKHGASSGVHHERERSPRRRDLGRGSRSNGRQRSGADGVVQGVTLPDSLPSQAELGPTEGAELQASFKQHAAVLQAAAQRLLGLMGMDGADKAVAAACWMMNDYINKACTLAAKLGILEPPPACVHGNEASSAIPNPPRTVPVSKVFSRIREVLPTTNMLEEDSSAAAVEQALRQFEIAAAACGPDWGPRPASPISMNQGVVEQVTQTVNPAAMELEDVEMVDASAEDDEQNQADNTPAVTDFFVTPPQPLLQANTSYADNAAPPSLAPPTRRRRRTFDMSKDIVAALSEMFNIGNDDDADELDQALAGLVNEGVAELQDAVQEMQMQQPAVVQPGEA